MGVIVVLGVALACILWLRMQKDRAPQVWADSLFSWEGDYMLPEHERSVQKVMEALGCSAIYQEVSEDIQEDVVLDYLDRRKAAQQDVYYLAGRAEWGLSPDGEPMVRELEKVLKWNQKAGGRGNFAGIVWDVEPYALDEWEEDPQKVMDRFVKNCIRVYEQMKAQHLNMIVCIPIFYQRESLAPYLERLIRSGCDAVAVMNYSKEDEAGQIAFDVELARKYDKGILHITEMQRPGKHELTEENTYYNDGIGAVSDSHKRLAQTFDYSRLGFSWHYLKPILEIMEEDGADE